MGLHKLALAKGEDGHCIDRFVITTQKKFNPSAINNGKGPTESYHGLPMNKRVENMRNIR